MTTKPAATTPAPAASEAPPARFVEDTGYDLTAHGKEENVARERAVMTRAWVQLKGANLIPAAVDMKDSLPPAAKQRIVQMQATGEFPKSDKVPTTYEAAMRVLVTDQDKNGHLDLDVGALVASGVVSGGMKDELTQKVHTALTDLPAGVSKDGLTREVSSDAKTVFGGLNDKGQALLEATRDVRLTSAGTRDADSFMRTEGAKAKSDPSAFATKAMDQAKALTARGDPEAATSLLTRATSALMAAGNLDQAKTVVAALKQPPAATTLVNQLGLPATTKAEHSELAGPGGKVTIDAAPKEHTESGKTIAARFDRQIALTERMQKELGRPVDPFNLEQVGAWFQQRSNSGADTKAMAKDFASYAEAFYVHAGHGVSYPGWPENDRPGKAQEVLDGTLTTQAGRRVVDCEGFTYLMHSLATNVKSSDGSPRFAGAFVATETHITLFLSDRQSGGTGAMYVNNDGISARSSKNEEVLLASVLAEVTGSVTGRTTRTIGIDRQPGGTASFDDAGLPVVRDKHLSYVVSAQVDPSLTLQYQFAQVTPELRKAFGDYYASHQRPQDNDDAMSDFLKANPRFLSDPVSRETLQALRGQ